MPSQVIPPSLKSFGSRLARYASSNASYTDTGIETSWRAGDCWTMAAALRRWIGPSAQVVALWGRRDRELVPQP